MRRRLIVGNWKMNPPLAGEAAALAEAIVAAVVPCDAVDVVVCPPAIWLERVRGVLCDGPIQLGGQTMHWADSGAHTGEISPAMLVGDAGNRLATHVIIGHSERRQADGETDETVARKVASALDHGLVPIAAIGEQLDERRSGAIEEVITRQALAAIGQIGDLAGRTLAVAYEPVWAIGTGMAASPADAQAVANLIRERLREVVGDAADAVPILYGGSVTGENAAGFFAQPDIDGALVGGASLRANEFAAIVRAAAVAAGEPA